MTKKKPEAKTKAKKKPAKAVARKTKVQLTAAEKRMYWIGIGASAGGLEALRELTASIPRNTRNKITYIVAQHLSPKHQSMLVQLVGRETTLTVEELQNGTVPKPGIMYITPPNKDVFVEQGILHLRKPVSELSSKPSVDRFFTSLAEDIGDHAVGVILSGTGSDGSHGVRAIRAGGGITVIQDPETAKYDGMPNSSIETGCADLVLPPQKIFKEISKILRSPNNLRAMKGDDVERTSIQELLHLLKVRSGVDFKDYKTGTLYRRIDRRMTACNALNLDEYIDYIQDNHEELDLLFRDIMISVTSFFRDIEAFEGLAKSIKDLIAKKDDDDPIRVWVPGCATGEEVYSIAILFAEACGGVSQLTQNYNFQIFATDIDTEALSRARKGLYPAATLENVDKKIRDKYFRHRDHSYEIIKSLRDAIVFSKHNVFEDPPFLRIDLIACRNLLIYFNSKLQHTVMNLFHYALNPTGALFLGKSEALGQSASLFQATDNKSKIYKRKLVMAGDYERNPKAMFKTIKSVEAPATQTTAKAMHDLPDAFIQALSPDSILIDENMDVVRIYGDVQAYTQLSPGSANMNLASLARKEFRQELRALVYKILREESQQTVLPKKMNVQGTMHQINIIIRPLHIKNSAEKLLLVSFEKVKRLKNEEKSKSTNGNHDPLIVELEQELSATKEHLQTVVEELETSNEELQSTNEEMQSTNEELQSSNEELETANEELQSTNEELLTVNEELQVKAGELTATNEDLSNIKSSIDFPILVVDKDLKITQFNAAARDVFILNRDSQGEALTSIATAIDIDNLRKNVMGVIKNGRTFQRQIEGEEVSYYERILPYRDEDKHVQGAVLTYINNTSEMVAMQKFRESEERYDLAVRGSNCGVWDWGVNSKEMYWSPVLEHMLDVKKKKPIYKFKDFEKRIHEDDYEDVMAILDAHLKRGFEFNVEFRIEKTPDNYIWVHMRGQAEWDKKKKPYRMAGSIYDVSERRYALDQLTHSNQSLERFAYVCSHDLKEPTRIVENFADLLLTQHADQLNAEARKYLGHMQESSKRMQEMVKDILTYSQLENKGTAFTLVDTEAEVTKVLENLKLAIEEKGAVITYDKLPEIRADRMQLFQIFQNLISNAIKFCKAEKPTVVIKSKSGKEFWEFSIKDNGIGMSQEYATGIFEVFKRLNNVEDFPGTGIGLSICQKIIQKHGGKIWVKSSEGKGATFYFTIPKKQNRRKANNVYSIENQVS